MTKTIVSRVKSAFKHHILTQILSFNNDFIQQIATSSKTTPRPTPTEKPKEPAVPYIEPKQTKAESLQMPEVHFTFKCTNF